MHTHQALARVCPCPAPRRAQPRRVRGAAPKRRSPTDPHRTFKEPPAACRERARECLPRKCLAALVVALVTESSHVTTPRSVSEGKPAAHADQSAATHRAIRGAAAARGSMRAARGARIDAHLPAMQPPSRDRRSERCRRLFTPSPPRRACREARWRVALLTSDGARRTGALPFARSLRAPCPSTRCARRRAARGA